MSARIENIDAQLFEPGSIYLQNLRFVQTHNSDPTKKYKVSMNHFAALTPSEYKQMFGFIPPVVQSKGQINSPSKGQKKNHKTTESLDWRDKGVDNAVKNQHACG